MCLNIYTLGLKKGTEPEILKKYERKTANHLFWAPTGQFVVLAGLRSMNGVLEFIDTSDFTSMGVGEHFMCTDVEWDPTGIEQSFHSRKRLYNHWKTPINLHLLYFNLYPSSFTLNLHPSSLKLSACFSHKSNSAITNNSLSVITTVIKNPKLIQINFHFTTGIPSLPPSSPTVSF